MRNANLVALLTLPTQAVRQGVEEFRGGWVSPTVTTTPALYRVEDMIENKNIETANKYRIRKITPLEAWILMGFSEEDFLSAKTGSKNNARQYMQEFEPDKHLEMMQAVESKNVQKLSNSQLYKQAGNSITTCTLYYIYKNLYKAMPYLFDGLKVGSFFSGIGAFEKALDMLQEDLRDGKKPFFVIEEE